MRYMLEEPRFLVLKRNQALSQPIELFTQLLDIARPGHANASCQLALAETMYGQFEIADRPRQQIGESGDHQHNRRDDGEYLPEYLASRFCRLGAQGAYLPINQLIDDAA